MKPRKNVLITDLDNTLFDWVEIWIRCFSAMLNEVLALTGLPEDKLKSEIASVHQKHGTSEYSFLLEEVPSLQEFLNGRSATEVFEKAIRAYRDQRKEHLKLYPGVAEALLRIKGAGTRIIGYTESMAFYSNYRLKRLGLDGVLEHVFCPRDHELPSGLSKDDLRKYPAEHYTLKYTAQDFTPPESKKPDVEVLDTIIRDLGLRKESCLYVGDSLMKDVAMAIDCGVDDVWAKYGLAHRRAEYKLLQEVTHWTAEEVAREQKIKEREHVNPTYVLEGSLLEIVEMFEFQDFGKW